MGLRFMKYATRILFASITLPDARGSGGPQIWYSLGAGGPDAGGAHIGDLWGWFWAGEERAGAYIRNTKGHRRCAALGRIVLILYLLPRRVRYEYCRVIARAPLIALGRWGCIFTTASGDHRYFTPRRAYIAAPWYSTP